MTDRNELCACGSGLKTKKCCGSATGRKTNPLLPIAVVTLIGAAAIYAGLQMRRPAAAPTPSASAPAANAAAASPFLQMPATAGQPADAPGSAAAVVPGGPDDPPFPGAVWSAEHGHWHDPNATPAESPVKIEAVSGGGGVNVDGGKISIDMNEIARERAQMTGGTPPPPGPAPEGKVWSTEHGHWHEVSAPPPSLPLSLGTVNRPKEPVATPVGPAPAGYVWNAEHGHWHKAPAGTAKTGTQ